MVFSIGEVEGDVKVVYRFQIGLYGDFHAGFSKRFRKLSGGANVLYFRQVGVVTWAWPNIVWS